MNEIYEYYIKRIKNNTIALQCILNIGYKKQ